MGAIFTLVAILVASSNGESVSSPSLETCGSLKSSVILEKVSGLPQSIQDHMMKISPAIAPRGGKFQAGDVLESPPLPTRRFVGAIRRGNTWVISYEHTQGNVYHLHVVVYGQSPSGDYHVIPHGNLTGPLCATVEAALSGVRSADPGHF